MQKCGKCIICSHVIEGNAIENNRFTQNFYKKVTCKDSNIVYLIECQKDNYKKIYGGFSKRQFSERMCKHLGYVRNKVRPWENITTYQDIVRTI